MSSRFGTALKVQIFGQSHAPAIGVCIDGFPVGFSPDFDALDAFLARRAPGQGAYATARKEADKPEFLSGLVDGHTCGAPITATSALEIVTTALNALRGMMNILTNCMTPRAIIT